MVSFEAAGADDVQVLRILTIDVARLRARDTNSSWPVDAHQTIGAERLFASRLALRKLPAA